MKHIGHSDNCGSVFKVVPCTYLIVASWADSPAASRTSDNAAPAFVQLGVVGADVAPYIPQSKERLTAELPAERVRYKVNSTEINWKGQQRSYKYMWCHCNGGGRIIPFKKRVALHFREISILAELYKKIDTTQYKTWKWFPSSHLTSGKKASRCIYKLLSNYSFSVGVGTAALEWDWPGPDGRMLTSCLCNTEGYTILKVKLLPKSNQGFICDWICVKPLCKSIIMTKEALLRFTVVLFSGKLIFNGTPTQASLIFYF